MMGRLLFFKLQGRLSERSSGGKRGVAGCGFFQVVSKIAPVGKAPAKQVVMFNHGCVPGDDHFAATNRQICEKPLDYGVGSVLSWDEGGCNFQNRAGANCPRRPKNDLAIC